MPVPAVHRAFDATQPDRRDPLRIFLQLPLKSPDIIRLLVDWQSFDLDPEFDDNLVFWIERFGGGKKSNVGHILNPCGALPAVGFPQRRRLKTWIPLMRLVRSRDPFPKEMNAEPASAALTEEETAPEPTLEERMRGAIWGQFVGDALCLGSHWIYNLTDLERTYPDGVHGFEQPREGHYHFGKQPGDQTHYGDGALVMVESVAELGHFDETDFLRRFAAKFGAAEYAGYCDKATRGTLENLAVWREEHPDGPVDAQNGADDDQLATASRLASVVVAHRADDDLLGVAERATRVCQNNERAVVYMKANALILRELLRGRDLHSALHRAEEGIIAAEPKRGVEVRRKIAAGMNASLKSVLAATVDEFGQSCPLASSFPSSIHCAVKHSGSFADALLANARAGGDNAGRAGFIGGWLGATLGFRAIPAEWRERLTAGKRIGALVEELMAKTRLQSTNDVAR